MAGFQIILDKVLTQHVLSGKRGKAEDSNSNPNSNPMESATIANYTNYALELSGMTIQLETGTQKGVQIPSKSRSKTKPVRVTKETKVASKTTPIISAGFSFLCMSLIRMIILEKRSGLKGLLVLLGVPSWIQPFSLYLCSALLGVLSAGLATLSLTCSLWPDFPPMFPQSNPLLLFLVILVTIIQSISITFATAPFFNTPYLGVLSSLILNISLSFGLVMNLADMSNFQHHLVIFCVPPTSYAMLMYICGAYELMGVGFQWDHFSKTIPGVGSMSPSDIFILMGISSLTFLILAQYLDNVLPQSFAVSKPFYYPLAVFPCKTKSAPAHRQMAKWNNNKSTEGQIQKLAVGFEAEPQGMEPGVSICNLRKEFGNGSNLKVAVDGINLNLYRGQITALLGFNGAGKTTLISMLTGLLKPTSGTAIIDGYDLNEDLTLIRHKLALCPQQNVLCNDLTVYENLLFFGQLKGLNLAEAEKEASTLMTSLGLIPKKECLAKVLSGGQKRKVQLGISFIGGSSFIFLDEPTSAMDVESRRLVWDLLLEMRKERTILLTTHYLEEAEVLGDRIAIQDRGRLKCCGTSFFLKQFFEMGYTLHLQFCDRDPHPGHCGPDRDHSYHNDSDGNPRIIKVLEKVREYLEGAKEKPRFSKNPYEFDISLPLIKKDGVGSKLSTLLHILNEKKEDLDLENIGLSATTMDDVFTAAIVGSNQQESKDGNTRAEKCYSFELDGVSSPNPNPTETELIKIYGFERSLGQFKALIRRRWQWTINDKILLAFQILVPILMAFSGTRSLSQYKLRFQTGAGAGISLGDLLLEEEEANMEVQELSLAIKSMTKAVLTTVAPSESGSGTGNVSLMTTRHYLNSFDSSVLDGGVNAVGEPCVHKYSSFNDMSSLFSIGLSALHISFVILPLQEKQSKVRHLELMTGVSRVTYWLSFLVWDFVLSSLIAVLCIFTIYLADGDVDLIQDGGLCALLITFSVCNFAGITFSYFLTTICGSPANGLIISIAVLTTGIVSVLVTTLVSMMSDALDSVPLLQYFYLALPFYGSMSMITTLTATAAANSKCNFPFSKEIRGILCNRSVTEIPLSDGRRACCANCQQDFPGAPCFKSRKYFVWDIDKTETVDGEALSIFGEFPGLGQTLFIVLVTGFVYLLVFWASECKIWRRVRHLPLVKFIFQFSSPKFPSFIKRKDEASLDMFDPVKDQDVKAEAQRVQQQLQKSGNFERDFFIAENLYKRYGKFRAVSNVSFGVHPGECFGLLGVNGAGKSSLFKILTGEKLPSFGNAHVQMPNGQSSLKGNRKNYLAEIGYCPQSDALLDMLTGKQSLELFARLRGCAETQVDTQVNRWLTNLGLDKSANCASGQYSGGMKRRLNVAMALIGNPSVIFLDEPSAGVDPISRQQFWRVISSLKNSGQSVIITSHCMDEVENLCSRMTIMVSSVLQCFGSGKHLKEQFPQGYVLKIQLKIRASNVESPELNILLSCINEKFRPCILKESYQNFLTFSLKNQELSLAQTFAVMEELLSRENSLIQDFSLGKPTLEQVFLAVAGYESQQSETITTK